MDDQCPRCPCKRHFSVNFDFIHGYTRTPTPPALDFVQEQLSGHEQHNGCNVDLYISHFYALDEETMECFKGFIASKPKLNFLSQKAGLVDQVVELCLACPLTCQLTTGALRREVLDSGMLEIDILEIESEHTGQQFAKLVKHTGSYPVSVCVVGLSSQLDLAGLHAVLEALEENDNLQKLRFIISSGRIPINHPGNKCQQIRAFADSLEKFSQLEELSFEKTFIENEDESVVARGLAKSWSLTTIEIPLSINHGCLGLRTFAKFVTKRNKILSFMKDPNGSDKTEMLLILWLSMKNDPFNQQYSTSLNDLSILFTAIQSSPIALAGSLPFSKWQFIEAMII